MSLIMEDTLSGVENITQAPTNQYIGRIYSGKDNLNITSNRINQDQYNFKDNQRFIKEPEKPEKPIAKSRLIKNQPSAKMEQELKNIIDVKSKKDALDYFNNYVKKTNLNKIKNRPSELKKYLENKANQNKEALDDLMEQKVTEREIKNLSILNKYNISSSLDDYELGWAFFVGLASFAGVGLIFVVYGNQIINMVPTDDKKFKIMEVQK